MLYNLFPRSTYSKIPGATRKETRDFWRWQRRRGAGYTKKAANIKDVEYSEETIEKMKGYVFPARKEEGKQDER